MTAPSAPGGNRAPSRRALLTAAVATPAAGLAGALAADRPDPDPPADGKAPGAGPAPADGPTETESPDPPGDQAPFRPVLPSDGLVTNEYAFSRPDADDARHSRDWVVTSGSLLARWTFGWTGVPDGEPPGPGSALHTGSSVFRLVTRRRDFGDTAVRCWVYLRPPGATDRTPARDWDGGHLWLRYHSAQELYALSFRRRDGKVVLKRKHPAPGRPADEEGVYTTLATAGHALGHDRWHQICGTVSGPRDGRVRITLSLNGRTVLDAEDEDPGRLVTAGGVGLRGDNTEMAFFGFTAGNHTGGRPRAEPPAEGTSR
ncbi:hypothetical protein AB0I87_18085 [Streptomyces sp. NPDC049952]|uniref:hypothetical protein n=1 Tax=Streptomyces TaxID=1883 RepID=UPI002E790C07|nr:hypothetical protein [Streptomyces sp. JV181]MEE1779042.1 hypothetical protein [Streptomyces sp. JV181]